MLKGAMQSLAESLAPIIKQSCKEAVHEELLENGFIKEEEIEIPEGATNGATTT